MEIVIAGPGEVVIRFIDSKGETLVRETLVVSGSPSVEGRRTIDLSVGTTSGQRPLAPVLVRQSHPKQRVTFDSETPSASHRGAVKRSVARARSRRTRQADGSRPPDRVMRRCT